MAFAGNGAGLAAWYADSESRGALVYSSYNAASGTWSADQTLVDSIENEGFSYAVAAGDDDIAVVFEVGGKKVLATVFSGGQFGPVELLDETTDPDLQVRQVAVTSSGDGFAAVWIRDETFDPATFDRERVVRASVLAPGAADWTAAENVSQVGFANSPAITSNGTSYVAVWHSSDSTFGGTPNLLGNFWSGAAWQPADVTLDVDISQRSRAYALASNGSDYQIAWIKDDGAADSVFGRVLDSSLVLKGIESLEGSGDDASDLRIESNGSDFLVAWRSDPSPQSLAVTIGQGATWSAVETLDVLDENLYNYELASDGTGYAAIWVQKDTADDATSRDSVWASVYDGSWSAAELIENEGGHAGGDGTLGLLFDGSDYVAAWIHRNDSRTAQSIWSNSYGEGAWGAAERLGDVTDPYFSFDRPIAFALQGTDATAAWVEPSSGSGSALNVARRGDSWGTPQDVAQNARGSGVELRTLLSNAAGQTLALWQQRSGDESRIYGAVQDTSGTWSDPEPFAGLLADSSVYFGAAAASDTGFAVLFQEQDPSTGEASALAAVYDGQAWAPMTEISIGLVGRNNSFRLASNGSGFGAAWRLDPPFGSGITQSIQGSVYESGVWSLPVQLDDGANETNQSPEIASNGTGYAVTWDQLSPTAVPLAVYDGADWSAEQTIFTPTFSNNTFPAVMSDDAGYAVFWHSRTPGDTVDNIYASISATGAVGDFTPAARVSNDSVSAMQPIGASDGAGYALIWNERNTDTDSEVVASVWDGAAWSAPQTIDAGAFGTEPVALVASDSGYAAAWLERTSESYLYADVVIRVFDGTSWGAPTTLFARDEDTFFRYDDGLVASNGPGYAATWVEPDLADGFRHVRLASFDSGDWTKQQLETQAAGADISLVTGVGETYTVVWAQPDPSGDPQVALPWAYAGLP